MAEIVETNVLGTANVFEACAVNDVEKVVFASSHHVMGMYELDRAPDLYTLDDEFTLDHHDPVRPDSRYGVAKVFGEELGKYYVGRTAVPRKARNYEYALPATDAGEESAPRQCYSLRIASVRHQEHDHPYADAESAVEAGTVERDSEAYEMLVTRMKATWHSRRDFAHMLACCLDDESVTYDVFYGVSDNDRRWFDIEHARSVIGYNPKDNGEEWTDPPSSE